MLDVLWSFVSLALLGIACLLIAAKYLWHIPFLRSFLIAAAIVCSIVVIGVTGYALSAFRQDCEWYAEILGKELCVLKNAAHLPGHTFAFG